MATWLYKAVSDADRFLDEDTEDPHVHPLPHRANMNYKHRAQGHLQGAGTGLVQRFSCTSVFGKNQLFPGCIVPVLEQQELAGRPLFSICPTCRCKPHTSLTQMRTGTLAYVICSESV